MQIIGDTKQKRSGVYHVVVEWANGDHEEIATFKRLGDAWGYCYGIQLGYTKLGDVVTLIIK